VYDVHIVPPGKSEKQDAIVFEIDHVDSYSVRPVFPYILHGDSAEIEEALTVAGKHLIFSPPSTNSTEDSKWQIPTETLSSKRCQ
jgi:hypothetical protein